MVPLYKKKSVYDAINYRGIRLALQLSKVVERLVKSLLMPFISRSIGFGANQFAYTPGRGARDALARLLLLWLQALVDGKRIAVYCSDVSGAFDRVKVERLVAKLRLKQLHVKLIQVLESWLRQRSATVIVGGKYSDNMDISDMVYQGTVLGPILWNLFFEDARLAIQEMSYTEVVYADDLNAFRIVGQSAETETIEKSLERCQSELHSWGKANRLAFDAGKESQHILSITDSVGESFRMLGVVFDCELIMADAVAELVTDASWKLRTLIRTRRFYTDADLILLYKSHLLSYLEYRTPAIYHATRNVLEKLDAVQTRFHRDVGVNDATALLEFNLAPLCMRRDIAMLGMLHRAALGEGPPQLKELFCRSSSGYMLQDPYADIGMPPLVIRSAWGLLRVYKSLGSGAHSIGTTRDLPPVLLT